MLSLLFSRYTLGAAAVAWYAYPAIREAAAVLDRVAYTLATLPGLGQ